MSEAPGFEVELRGVARAAQGIAAFEFARPGGRALPAFGAGAHVAVTIADGARRWTNAYTLTGDPRDRERYRIAVLRQEAGRGGSRFLHDRVRVGDRFRLRGPASFFGIDWTARRHLLVAGGIGVTPIVAMARELLRQGRAFEIHYAVGSLERAAFLEELTGGLAGGRGAPARIYASDRGERMAIRDILSGRPLGTHLYACGPQRLIAAALSEARALGWPASALHAERFAAPAGGAPFARGIAWVEGAFTPLAEARVPLLDQGFLHCDLTYDVPAVWDGRYFRLDDHLDRLEESCRKLRLKSPLDRAALRAVLVEMVARSGIRDAFVQVIVTRGPEFVRAVPPEEMRNALYLFAMPYVWAMPPDLQRRGAGAVVTRTVRRVPPGAMDPTVKNLQWGDFIRGLFEARDRGAIYPILPDGDGNVTEGSGYNVFFVKDGVLHTPARGVLEGVTRRTVLEIAAARGWEVRVEHVPVDLAYGCDEIFFSTTAGGIMPVAELDGRPVGGGQVAR